MYIVLGDHLGSLSTQLQNNHPNRSIYNGVIYEHTKETYIYYIKPNKKPLSFSKSVKNTCEAMSL